MVIPKIVEFAANQLVDGKTIEDISTQLRSVGWNAHDVEDSMVEALKEAARIPKRKKSRGKSILLFLLIFFIVTPTSAYFLYESFPEVILEKAARKAATVKSAEYDMRIETDVVGIQDAVAFLAEDPTNIDKNGNTVLVFEAKGNYDLSTRTMPKAGIEIATKTPSSTGKVQDIAAKAIIAGPNGYFALTKLPDVPFFDNPLYFIERWVSVALPAFTVPTTYLPEDLTIQQKLLLRQKAIDTAFVAVSRSSSSELVDAVPVHSIAYTVDLGKVLTFYKEVRAVDPTLFPTLTPEQEEAIASQVKLVTKPIAGVILIGKKDSLVYRVSSTIDFVTPDENIEGTIQVTMTTRKHNANFSYVPPENTTSYEDFVQKMNELVQKAVVLSTLDMTKVEDREKKRAFDLLLLTQGFKSYFNDNHTIKDLGILPLCTAGYTSIGTGAASLNLLTTLVPEYLLSLPMDPVTGSEKNTGYTICLQTETSLLLTASNKESVVKTVVEAPKQ